MNHRDRLDAALRAKPRDRLPAALWRTWPEVDRDPGLLARAVMGRQCRFDFDPESYPARAACVPEPLGARATYRDDAFGRFEFDGCLVAQPDHRLQAAPAPDVAARLTGPDEGLRRRAEAQGGTVPLTQSVPGPTTTAWPLAGDTLFEHMRTQPQSGETGLRTITDTTASHVRDAVAAGGCGIRLPASVPESAAIGADDHRRFVHRLDRDLLRFATSGRSWNVAELDVPLRWIEAHADYPAGILACGPQRRDGAGASVRARFPGLLAGGIDIDGPLVDGTASCCCDTAVSAIARSGRSKTLISTGGACRIDTLERHIDALPDAIRRPDRPATSSGEAET